MSESTGEKQPTLKCPYCGCGFIPQKPGQVYCSPFCEEQEKIDRERRAQA
jgi:uncharacterized Zn finger protein (UPF0148 family)